jgi:hypothetical protein
MIVYRAMELDEKMGRTHPWTFAVHDPNCRYVDFRTEPERIESALEDFRPWGQYPAVERFYALLRWLNGPESLFETNDCLLRIEDNTDPVRPYRLQAAGRLMLFPSDMRLTCAPDFIEWMMQCFDHYLRQIQPSAPAAAVGIAKGSCWFKSVDAEGQELILYFWAWGDTHDATMENLERIFERIRMAAENANEDVRASLIPNNK